MTPCFPAGHAYIGSFILSGGPAGEYEPNSSGINRALGFFVLFSFVHFYYLKARDDLNHKELYISIKVGRSWYPKVSILSTGKNLVGSQVAMFISMGPKVFCQHICFC